MKEYLRIEYLYKLYVCIRKSDFPRSLRHRMFLLAPPGVRRQ